jgi:hypothetical protein
LYEQSLVIRQELGHKEGIADCLTGLGWVAARMSEPKRGARLLGVAEAMLEAINTVMDADERMVYEQGAGFARAQLSQEEFAKAWAEGRAMSMEQAIEYALEGLGADHR